MSADVLRWQGDTGGGAGEDPNGTWVIYQDPITGEILNKWVPGTPDDPSIPGDQSTLVRAVPCIARGVVGAGLRMAGTTETFGNEYENIDFVQMWVPASIKISKRDRITNIRANNGSIIWKDYEHSTQRPTVFNVNGSTPLLDAFNRHIENFILLEKTNG